MAMSEKIRIVLIKRHLNVTELAKKIGTSQSNLSNKLSRDNFSERELSEIADALNCDFIGSFKFRDSDEVV